jgi:hypothetical protein
VAWNLVKKNILLEYTSPNVIRSDSDLASTLALAMGINLPLDAKVRRICKDFQESKVVYKIAKVSWHRRANVTGVAS